MSRTKKTTVTPEGGDVLLHKLAVVQRRLSISRSSVYALVNEGQLELVKVLKGSRITDASLQRLIKEILPKSSASP